MTRTNNRVKTASELARLAGVAEGRTAVLSFAGVDWAALRGSASYAFSTLCCHGRRGFTTADLSTLRIRIEGRARGRGCVTVYTSDGRLYVGYQYMNVADRKFIEACVCGAAERTEV